MQSFTLDLKTLLQILSRQKQNGVLQADISSDKLRSMETRQMMQAQVLLESGVVRSCRIVFKNGELLEEAQKALQLLLDAGVIEWHWEPGTSPLPKLEREDTSVTRPLDISKQVPSPYFTLVPQRTIRGEEVLSTLPREYRKILALVDGQRTVHKLAVILSMNDEEVMAVLRTLQSWGLIS